MDKDEEGKIGICSIGGLGLVGSRIPELLSDQYDFTTLDRKKGVDITDPQTLTVVDSLPHKIVILFAAKTDVDSCEKDRDLGEEGEAWKINVKGVENVISICQKNNKKLIYISTDFVFGKTPPQKDGFDEEDSQNPINWYGKTKYEAEKKVQSSGLPFLIIRIAYPYRKSFEEKSDFVRAIKKRLENNDKVLAITDHVMTPTFIDDIAFALDKLITTNETGIFHVVGSQFISPYDASLKIAKVFGLDQSLILKTTRDEFFNNRALRPFNLSLKNAKIQRLGVQMKSFDEGLFSLK